MSQESVSGEQANSNYKMAFSMRLVVCIFAVVVVVALAKTTSGSNVKGIDVYTADCEDCGMSILGTLSVKVGISFFLWNFTTLAFFCNF